jgi:hypothetical protein
MTTDKAAIAEALKTLDHTNDALWTDDGSPLVSEVQRLVNDKNVTRAQINEAVPGFIRKSKTSIDEETQAPVEPLGASAPETDFDDDGGEPEADVSAAGHTLSTDEIRAILQRRIKDAEQAITDAREATSKARLFEQTCSDRHRRAVFDFQRKFPPMSAAANIKAHLASQQALAMERAGRAPDGTLLGQTPATVAADPRSQIDQTLYQSKRRGGARPTRPILGGPINVTGNKVA